jgi:hypothetical protein
MRWRNRLIRDSVQWVLRASAAMARNPRTEAVSGQVMAAFGRAVSRWRHVSQQQTPGAIAEQWQRGFPAKKQVPIVSVDATTAYAEIHTPCPLRGSGDLGACYRMMAYDRAIAARAGGRFVVLESQATPGVSVCRVAMRASQLPADDLVPAHLKNAK